MRGLLRSGMSAAGKYVADMELDKKVAPVVEQGKHAARTGLGAVAHASSQVREVVSQEQMWERQHALVDQLVDVIALQQGLIEDLRDRVAALESSP
ncbi:hypothetical protein [Blastococcus sp. SYSU D01042]